MSEAGDYADAAKRFGAVAGRFCAIVDNVANLEKTEILFQVYRILPELIGEAIRLPDTDPWKRDEPDEPNEDLTNRRVHARIKNEEWSGIYGLMKAKLADADLYSTIFDPTALQAETIHGSLADDVADIYRDLKGGLVLTERNVATAGEVIWKWRFGFYSHWGYHATSALRTIHSLIADYFENEIFF